MAQGESGKLEQKLVAEQQRSGVFQKDLAASVKDSKQALQREADIAAQLEAQDQVPFLQFC